MVLLLNGLAVPVPAEFGESLLETALTQTPFAALSAPKPQPLQGSELLVQTGGYTAGTVGEGQPKPFQDATYDSFTVRSVKFAIGTTVSEEVAKLNPARTVSRIGSDLIDALSQGITHAMIHGTDPITKATIAGMTSLSQVTNLVTAGANGVDANVLMQAYALAEAGHVRSDPNAMLLDNKLRGSLLQLAQYGNGAGNGNFAAPVANLRQKTAVIGGLDAVFTKGVLDTKGTPTAADDSPVGYLGDYAKGLFWGYADDISLRSSTEATIFQNGVPTSLWQSNQIGYLAECRVAWYVDTRLFAGIKTA